MKISNLWSETVDPDIQGLTTIRMLTIEKRTWGRRDRGHQKDSLKITISKGSGVPPRRGITTACAGREASASSWTTKEAWDPCGASAVGR